ncbi:hypothetical protein GCM10027167_05080 [Nocardia heshunensis]
MKSSPAHRLPLLLAVGAAAALFTTGTATAAPAAPEHTATPIDGAIPCNDPIAAILRTLTTGSTNGSSAASGTLNYTWLNTIVCLGTGSKGTPSGY